MDRDEYLERFTTTVKKQLVVKNMTLAQLAVYMGKTRSELQEYFDYKVVPSEETIIRINNILQFDYKEFQWLKNSVKTISKRDRLIVPPINDFEKLFIESVRRRLVEKGITLKDLSHELNISESQFSDYMVRASTPHRSTIIRIGKALDFNEDLIDELLDLRSNMRH
ncbi:MAG: helix-turn-helix domain-containing protein [Ruminococcus sp.]|nr:helix-turn-helix domain-containing protein [Ruminococcus sp.]MBO5319113.1 helix-turn-helix domain-containing protein [Ruminococcus sp.]